MTTNLTRRELIKFGSSGALLTSISSQSVFGQLGTPVKTAEILPVKTDDEAPFTIVPNREDRRFRVAFLRAIRRLRLCGKLTKERFRELRIATFSSFAYFKNHRIGDFLQHLRRDVQQQAGDAWDDMITSAVMFMESLVQWLIESWNSIIGNIMTNLEEWKIVIAE